MVGSGAIVRFYNRNYKMEVEFDETEVEIETRRAKNLRNRFKVVGNGSKKK